MNAEPILALVLASDQNGLIGRDGGLPWDVPGELSWFKALTLGRPLIMGRRTQESIGRALPGRANIVISRNTAWCAPSGVERVGNLDEALVAARAWLSENAVRVDAPRPIPATQDEVPEIMLIGGAALAASAMPRVQRFYRTLIEHAFEGDTWLSGFDPVEWTLEAERVEQAGGYEVRYQRWGRD